MKHLSRASLVVYVLEFAGFFYLGCDSKRCDLDLHTQETTLVLLKGDTGSVLCDASCYGTHDITVTWTDPRGNEIGPHPDRIFSQLLTNGQLNKLVITGADTYMSGSYVCTAVRYGQVLQRRAIDVYVFEESTFDVSYKDKKENIPRFNDPTPPKVNDPTQRRINDPTQHRVNDPTQPGVNDPTQPRVNDPTQPRVNDPTQPRRVLSNPSLHPLVDDTDVTNQLVDDTDDGTNDYADMELLEAMAWNKKLAEKNSGNTGREIPLGYHDNALEPGSESLVSEKDGGTSKSQASERGEHVVNHTNFDALNDSDVEINDFHDTLPELGDEIPQSDLRYRRDAGINSTGHSGDDGDSVSSSSVSESRTNSSSPSTTAGVTITTTDVSTEVSTTPTITAQDISGEASTTPATPPKDDDGEPSTKPATPCTTPKPSNFGKYGVLAFAVSLSLAFLLLYAILMIVFMPRILARRRAVSQSDPEAQHYKKRHSDGLEAPHTMTSNDTTLSDNEAGDTKEKKDGDKSTTTESENENATAGDEGRENTDESTDQTKADDKNTEEKGDTKQDDKVDGKQDEKADGKHDPQQDSTQKPDDQNPPDPTTPAPTTPDPTTPAPGTDPSLLSSILNENFVGRDQPTPGPDHSGPLPDQDTSDLLPPPPSDSQLPVIDFTFDVRPMTTPDVTQSDEVDV